MAEDFLDGYRISFYCGAVSSTTSPDVTNIQSNLNSLVVALSHARQTGDSTVCIYDKEMHKEEQLRQYIEANMIRALEENEYQVYLQPKMNLRTGKIDSADVYKRQGCARWPAPHQEPDGAHPRRRCHSGHRD